MPPQDIAGISEQQIATLGHVDVVICGWPCQGVSRANRNPQGLWDARSHVFFDVVRIVQVLGQRQRRGLEKGMQSGNVSNLVESMVGMVRVFPHWRSGGKGRCQG